MNETNDYKKFSILMVTLGEATPGERPTPDKIEIYFKCLEDMDYETVEKNALEAVRMKGFFPLIPDIRREMDVDQQALDDYQLAKKIADRYVYCGFEEDKGRCNEIKLHLQVEEKEYLFDFIMNWGLELAYPENITATRSQALRFLKHNAIQEIDRKLLEDHGEFKKIGADGFEKGLDALEESMGFNQEEKKND